MRSRPRSPCPAERLLLAALAIAATLLAGCSARAESARPAALDLDGKGVAAMRAALAAAVRDDHPQVRRARRLGVTECRPDPGAEGGTVFCYVEFTSYRGSLRRFCTRTYETTLEGGRAEPARGWPLTCLRYRSRSAAREAREGKLTRREARREGTKAATGP